MQPLDQPFYCRVLRPTAYGFEKDGKQFFPSTRVLLAETFSRTNIFADRRNWVGFCSVTTLVLSIAYIAGYFTYSFTWLSFGFAIFWSCVEGHLWELIHHRGFTHGAFIPRNRFCTQLLRFLHTPIYLEENFHFAHLCHHKNSDRTGDPYDPKGGFLYIFLTDINHQTLRWDLTEQEYSKVTKTLNAWLLKPNTYKQYLYWGTAANPTRFFIHFLLVTGMKYSFFFWLGGIELATGFYLGLLLKGITGRFINFLIHGYGKDLRRPGHEFNSDLAINHWFGIFSIGQWHGHHHLYPKSGNTGLMPYQLDIPFQLAKLLQFLGVIKNLQNFAPHFQNEFYAPKAKPDPIFENS